MPNLIERRDPWGQPLSLWILAGMAFLIPVAFWGLSQTKLDNEVHDWVDGENINVQVFDWTKSHFPGEETLLFSWEDSHLDDPRTKRFTDVLLGKRGDDGIRRGGSSRVDRVRTPHQIIDQMEKTAKISRAEAVERLEGVLVGRGPLCIRLSESQRPHKQRVIEALQARAQKFMGLKIEVLPPTVQPEAKVAEISAEAASSGEAAELQQPYSTWEPHDFRVTWPGMQKKTAQFVKFQQLAQELPGVTPGGGTPIEKSFFLPGSPIMLTVSLNEAGLGERTLSLKEIREAAVAAGIPSDKIRMGGRDVASTALNREVLKAGWNLEQPWYSPMRSLLLTSGLVGGLLALWMLRSYRLTAIVLGVSYYSAIVCTAIVPLTGGSMNMVLVVMPTLLLVTTLSGAIHLANYWQHAAVRNPATAVSESVAAAWSPCFFASITTSLGLGSLMISSLKPVRDFGIYSALGVMFSFVVVMYGLPSILQFFPPRKPKADTDDHAAWVAYGGFITRFSTPIAIAVCITAVALTAGLTQFSTETKVIRYFDDDTRIVDDYNFLESKIGGIVPIEVVVRFDESVRESEIFLTRAQRVREIQREIRKLDDISGSISMADFIEDTPVPGPDASLTEKRNYSFKSRITESRVKPANEASPAAEVAADPEAGVATQSSSLIVLAPKATRFNTAGDELWRINVQVAVMSDVHYGDLTRQIDDVCRKALRTSSGKSGTDYRPIDQSVEYHPGASHYVTGMVPLFMATQDELLKSLIESFLLAFVTIGVCLMLQMKSFSAGLIAMVPNILPIGVVFGTISWAGMSTNIGTILTASIALGIAVDGTLHMVTWFRRGIEDGLSRRESTVRALCHCGPAMWQTSTVIGLGLIVLYPSDLILISRFGWLMTALVFTALFADTLLTPALLAGPMGYMIERSIRRRQSKATVSQGHSEAPVPEPHAQSTPMTARVIRLD